MNELKPEYTRVTECLYFLTGLSKVNPEVLKNAADRGTRVHISCDALIEGLAIFPQDDELGYIESFKKWYGSKTFLKKPDRWYDDEFMITGECDCIYKEDGELVLVDFKTPANESKTWSLQLSAYAYMAKKQGLQFKRIEAVKLCKQGRNAKTFIYADEFDLFKKCLEIYRTFLKQNRDIEIAEYL